MNWYEWLFSLPVLAIFSLAWILTRDVGSHSVGQLVLLAGATALWAGSYWVRHDAYRQKAEAEAAVAKAEKILDDLDRRNLLRRKPEDQV